MKHLKNSTLQASLFLLICFSAFTFQNPDLINQVAKHLVWWRSYLPQEKIFVHLDKAQYQAGDTVWYKLYLVQGSFLNADSLSGVAYTELLNNKGEKVSFQKVKVTNGYGNSALTLPPNIQAGAYRLRCYTQWMQNFDAAYFFEQELQIFNPKQDLLSFSADYKHSKDSTKVYFRVLNEDKATAFSFQNVLIKIDDKTPFQVKTSQDGIVELALPQQDKVVQFDLQCQFKDETFSKSFRLDLRTHIFDFMPEGGDLVVNLPSKVAYKASNRVGKSLMVKGQIFDDAGEKVTDFSTMHQGMGFFVLNPLAGKKYIAKVVFEDGSENTFSLPEATNKSVIIAVNNQASDAVSIEVRSTDASPKNYWLIAHARGFVSFYSLIKTEKSVQKLRIPRANMPEGITHLTLFDESGQALAERLFYVLPQSTSEAKISLNAINFAKRSLVEADVEIKDASGKPLEGNFSVSVAEADLANPTDINAYFQFADLKGKIENAGWYFQPENQKNALPLDLVMLTNGWRRFEWKNVFAEKMPANLVPLERNLHLSGRVVNYSGKAVEKPKVNVMLKYLGDIFMVEGNEKGEFTLEDLDVKDSVEMFFQAKYKKDNKMVKVILNPTIARPDALAVQNDYAFSKSLAVIEAMRKKQDADLAYAQSISDLVLDAVEIKSNETKAETETQVFRENRSKVFQADNVIKVSSENYASYNSILDMLQTRVPGVQVSGSGQTASVLIRGISTVNSSTEPLFLLDGFPVELSTINSIPVQDVATVEVARTAASTAIYGARGANGVIMVFTKKGGDTFDPEAPEGKFTHKFLAYANERIFYAPDYSLKHEYRPDLRSTLFWQANLKTDKNGKAKLKFYTADLNKDYQINLQGMNDKGVFVSKRLVFSVE